LNFNFILYFVQLHRLRKPLRLEFPCTSVFRKRSLLP